MPTPITFTLAQQSRAAGTYNTPNGTLPAGYGTFTLTLNLNTASYEDTSNQITWTAYASPDNGTTWNLIASATWTGGAKTSRGGTVDPPPVIVTDVSGWTGQKVRGTFNLNNTMTVGLTATLT